MSGITLFVIGIALQLFARHGLADASGWVCKNVNAETPTDVCY